MSGKQSHRERMAAARCGMALARDLHHSTSNIAVQWPTANIVMGVIVAPFHIHNLPKRDVNSRHARLRFTRALGNTVQPIGLRRPPHHHHVSAPESKLLRAHIFPRLVLHHKVTRPAQAERGDARVAPEERLVVGVRRDRVRAISVEVT